MAHVEMKSRLASGRRNSRRGLATVEMALLLPILLLITFCAIEYGWMFLKQQQITNCARQAARLAATPSATNAQVTARVTTLMTDAGLAGSGYTLTTVPADITKAVPATGTVQVKVSVNYAAISITHMTTPPLKIPQPNTLSATVTMGKEGP